MGAFCRLYEGMPGGERAGVSGVLSYAGQVYAYDAARDDAGTGNWDRCLRPDARYLKHFRVFCKYLGCAIRDRVGRAFV